jgi:NADH:ubiquinone oxidoreductase subunit K
VFFFCVPSPPLYPAVGLAIILAIFRHAQSVDLRQLTLLKG